MGGVHFPPLPMKRLHPAPDPPRWGPLAPQWRGHLGREPQDGDSWLGAMNAVALALLLMALAAALPEAEGRLGAADLPRETETGEVFVAVDLPPGPVAAEAVEAASGAAAAYPELEALVEPVELIEPSAAPRELTARPTATSARATPAREVSAREAAGREAPAQAAAGREAAVGAAAAGPGRAVGPVGRGGGAGSNPQPPYPAFARRQRLQGTVVLRIAVRDGAVAEVVVARSSGSAGLDRHAAGHVERSWRWARGTEQTFTQAFRFVLQ